MELIKTLLEATSNADLINKVKLAKSIIKKYETNAASYNDFLVRILGYTNGISRPSEKDESINIIPALEELARRGLVTKNKNGTYKRSEALSKLMAIESKSAESRALSGDLSRQGRLGLTQTSGMSHLVGDDSVGDKLNRARRDYKKGGLYSGTTKELIQSHTKDNDEQWKSLSSDVKTTIGRLQTLENPLASLKILQSLVKMKQSKKGYVPFVQYVMDAYKDESYVDALFDLDTVGVLDYKKGTISMQEVSNIKTALDFFKEHGDRSIPAIQRVAAFLPRFAKQATTTSARQHRAVNKLLRDPGNKKLFDIIDARLTDTILDDILNSDLQSLKQKPTAFNIRLLANTLNAETVDELKAAIQKKRELYDEFKSVENKAAKDQGRFDRFKKDF